MSMRQRSSRMEDTCIEYFNILVARMIQQHFCGQMDFPIQWFGLSLHLYIYKYHNPGSSSKIFGLIYWNNKNIVANVCDSLQYIRRLYFVLDDNDLSDLTCQIDTNLQPPQQLNCLSATPWTSHAQHFCRHYIRKSNTTPVKASESTKYSLY